MRDESLKKLNQTAKRHIENLEKRLTEIYTIDIPEEIKSQNNKNIDLRTELEVYSQYEGIYKVVESNPKGEVYTQYINYLQHIKDLIEYLLKEKIKVEEIYKDDIENANKLIDEFSKFL